MGCSSCSTKDGLPGGCKNNGACGTYGCNKLDVFDWLSGMELPDGQKPFDIVEVRFKNSRKGFFRNGGLELVPGDVVAVESSPGHDIGVVSLTGELVRIQMKKKDIKDNYEVKKVYRKAKQEDIEKWQEARQQEKTTMMRAREIARELNLQMKISDVEYQGDKTKATFYYTAEDRVDFRELIKRYAETFRVRIEMRQIGYRAEAGRLGGIGSCGRELCCSTWLNDFRAVSTSAARYQQLSLNPAKLAGQCGKLKCCLNYELDQYVEALRELPNTNVKLRLPKGLAFHMKTDIFKRVLVYGYEGQPGESPITLSVEAVNEIIEKNKKGQEIGDVEEYVVSEEPSAEETDFAQVVGQDSLTRFDRKKRPPQKRRGSRDNRDQKGGAPQSGEPRPSQPPKQKSADAKDRPPQNRERRPQQSKPNPEKGPGTAPGAPQGQRPKPNNPQGPNQDRNRQRGNRGPRREKPGGGNENPPS